MLEDLPPRDRSPLWTLEEIGRLVSKQGNASETLSNVAQLIQHRFQTDVCSVYLLEPDRKNLVLAATVGLHPDSVGRVRMRLDEGLAGLVAEQLLPQFVANAPGHPRFKYFPEAGEDPYHSFLGIPLLDRGLLEGVLVVQTRDPREFHSDDVSLLTLAGTQLAQIVSEARTQGQVVAPAYEHLRELAQNLWWCWDPDATSLFRELDPILWQTLDNNPVALLQQIPIDRLEERVSQLGMRSRINYAYRRMHEYLSSKDTWGARHAGVLGARPVAYFSAEFGLHESVPIYSGGLGILAGDHIKSCSDLGIPVVGVGLYYDQGYFRQHINQDGWQEEHYIDLDHRVLPLKLAVAAGVPVVVGIETQLGRITARVWQLSVGRNTVLLLDSNVEGNAPEDRKLTSRLYGGDDRIRIRQELLLGVGGVRALAALGISPGVLHLNEGHSAFAPLEAMRERMAVEQIHVWEAMRRVSSQVVFTTHTPVAAGHDRFDAPLMDEHLGPLRDALGLTRSQFMGLGRVEADNPHESFCMTVLALKLCHRANAVSSLHRRVSRTMWRSLYPDRTEDRVPIGHITNGVHIRTWLAPQMRRLYDRHLGPNWLERASAPRVWDRVDAIDDGELWETHQTLKQQLIDLVRRRVVHQAERLGAPPHRIAQLRRSLSFDGLTIGFARRFATYKRANLLMQDVDALAALVNDPKTPIQLVFAGKSHPHDKPGKEMLQQIVRLSMDPRFIGKLVFLEDYDIRVGRHLVQGVDLWVSNPRRPLEACGTSGQKVVLNGGLNLSVLDGWWAEAFDGLNGFAIGMGEQHSIPEVQDARDGVSLMEALRSTVIPLYYARDRDGLPRQWIGRMKRAIRTLGWRFSADRMVIDYVRHTYRAAAGGTSSDFSGL